MKKFLLIFFVIDQLPASSQTNTFFKQFDVVAMSNMNNFQRTADNGYVVSVNSLPYYSSNDTLDHGYLIKTDITGNLQWSKKYPKSNQNSQYSNDANAVFQTRDCGYVIATSVYNDNGNQGKCEAMVIKLDASGDLEWSRLYRIGTFITMSQCIRQTSDNGFIFCGVSYDALISLRYAFLAKITEDGTVSWIKKYYHPGSANPDCRFYSVNETREGDFIASGKSNMGAFLIKTDLNGNLIWGKSVNTPGSQFYSSMESSTGNYIAIGTSPLLSGVYRPVIIAFDSLGNILFAKNFNVTGNLFSVKQYPNNDYILSGWINDSLGGNSRIFRTNSSGDIIWSKKYSVPDALGGVYSCIDIAQDGGIAMLWKANDPLQTNGNYGNTTNFIKTDENGYIGCGSTDEMVSSQTFIPTWINDGAFVSIDSSSNYALHLFSDPVPETVICQNYPTDQTIEVDCRGNPVDCLHIPNIFSPNSDSQNDFFEIDYCENESYEIKVFDRWGILEFKSSDKNIHWDGKNKSHQPCADGTYYYILNTGEEINKGFITLVR